MRTNDDGVVLDTHVDFRLGLNVDLLENRRIEDHPGRVSDAD
jgi:hypothetical protein